MAVRQRGQPYPPPREDRKRGTQADGSCPSPSQKIQIIFLRDTILISLL